MKIISALLAGLIFGIGLILSGMTNPAKVIGFLDLTGQWDPSLAFVMGGAIFVGSIAFWFAGKRTSALLGGAMQIPTSRKIDRRLIAGGAAFGIGWGLAGYCPGPALASILGGGIKPLVFVGAMLVGMALYEVLDRQTRSATPEKAA